MKSLRAYLLFSSFDRLTFAISTCLGHLFRYWRNFLLQVQIIFNICQLLTTTGHLCHLEVFSSPSKELSLTTASLLVAHCPNLVELKSIDFWGEKEEVARWRREMKEANMVIETGTMLDTAHCYRTDYPRPCFANLSSE